MEFIIIAIVLFVTASGMIRCVVILPVISVFLFVFLNSIFYYGQSIRF
jgi:hypothetical protein